MKDYLMNPASQPTSPETPATSAAKPAYAVPQVTTYTDAALLEQLGPAQAGGTYTVFGGP
jgi:hypothetical protein